MHFEFATATRIVFGSGKFREAGMLARGFGQRALIVTGRDVTRAEPLIHLLLGEGVRASTCSVPGEPEIRDIENGVALAKREECELVISFGGGSALDAGKAIAAMLSNAGALIDYLEIIGQGKALTAPPVPFIAIPTTAGTGAEVTRNAVIGSPEHRLKVSLRSPLMLPKVALVDPELTLGLPPDVTARTGLDALTQLIEPFVCSRANPVTDALCREGIRRAARSLRNAVENGRDLSAREDMALASLFGGLALANAGLGAVHGFAGPIGGMFSNAPHGAICAALLPHVMETNVLALQQRESGNQFLLRYEQLARWLTGHPQATIRSGIDWVHSLVQDLRIPRLRTYGITPEHFPELISKATNASSMRANPIALTPDELNTILKAAL
jgi:alcohol dehydrogenase class IV